MSDFADYKKEMDIFWGLQDEWAAPEDFYEAFSKMCIKYSSESLMPYLVCEDIIESQCACEDYYMQMLMDTYVYYAVGDSFLDLLQELIDEGYCEQSKENACNIIKDYIKDGYVIAYRGEFASEKFHNLDYTESVSFTLSYERAKFFATRFKTINLIKSVVYTVKVPVDDILAYLEREEEVVCIPISMGGKMEVIKEENML